MRQQRIYLFRSEREDVEGLLRSLNLNPCNYQLGQHKVFLRESEKIKLDYFLHQQILTSIVCIQRWYRSILERRQFLRLQKAVVSIQVRAVVIFLTLCLLYLSKSMFILHPFIFFQSYVRMFLAQRFVVNLKMMHLAATYIQKIWRGHRVRKWYQNLRQSCVQFQARVRGNVIRQRVARIREERKTASADKLVNCTCACLGTYTDKPFIGYLTCMLHFL